MPINIPSHARARAFLWLVYHYLEDPHSTTAASLSSSSSSTSSPKSSIVGSRGQSTNPFSDAHARAHPGRVPALPRLSIEEMQDGGENIDPPDELQWGDAMCMQRTAFLTRLVSATEIERQNRNQFTHGQGELIRRHLSIVRISFTVGPFAIRNSCN